MNISIEQLQAFVCVARCGSFSAAARELGKAQSSISEQVAALEINFNAPLFDRTQHKPQLTDIGRSLLRNARALLVDLQDMEDKANSLSLNEDSSLTFAYDELVMPASFLYDVLSRFDERFPYVEFEVLQLPSEDILNLTREGRVNVGVRIFQESSALAIEGVNSNFIGQINLRQVAAPDHPLAALQEITEYEMHTSRKLALASVTHDPAFIHPSAANRVWYVSDLHNLLELVRRGYGYCWAPLHIAEEEVRAGRLVYLDITAQVVSQPWGVEVLATRQRPQGVSGDWLVDVLSQYPSRAVSRLD